ncbi:GH116 family glycosyl-hydrolase [Aquiflexum sp. TKW24L]|uniref:GH116 family glycosyl-hydrolase n=1 Tax=Aquiflexum sp. TKW24L TaxID=2942212 RepID=UPI0020BDD08D|nr:GH116 family glycosyl-hydrolase [Aquiflexum sp. TKW24L]MCL6260129.1 GH116 family glycosyl-hydrolase [Aquiflexum sp. TKW24L]
MREKSDHKSCIPNSGCCSPSETSSIERSIVRRDFLKFLGLASGGVLLGFPAIGMKNSSPIYTIPTDKGLSPEWYKSLYERGAAEVYSGKELAYIGMPIGGMFTGTVYIGGDGKLWLWNIFNEEKEGISSKEYENWQGKKKVKPRDGANFIFPVSPEYPFEQGFGIMVKQGKNTWKKSLDFKGFDDITFNGQYPIAEVSYRDSELPVAVDLQSFSPFVPLDVDASSYPATIMRFKATNTSNKNVSVELAGWLENATLNNTKNSSEVTLINTISEVSGNTILTCSAQTNAEELKQQRDFGNMSLSLLAAGPEVKAEAGTQVTGSLLFPKNEERNASTQHGEQLCGALSKTINLKPNETQEITFIISWYFPNIILPQNKKLERENKGRYYKKRFQNSQEVAEDIATKYEDLYRKTTSWRNTFYEDSTLPHWFLNRTFVNTSILATETCYLLEDGRFWAWEGIGCCPGTCTHVWHYAQAIGRIFPELERNLREKTDFDVIDDLSGGIDFRGGMANKNAADGQAGIVLRAYRDYQMSTNDEFLKEHWENIKLALQYLINLDKEDGEANGAIYGEQHNTLDAEWYGNIPVITSLYLAALAASVAMAKVMHDTAAEEEYTAILAAGQKNIEKLFNGEYFIQNEDSNKKDAIGIGKGCYIDQVFGQSWANQVGLGQVYNKEMIDSSLESLWKYNFVPDVGPLRASLSPAVNGRPYALAGDAGMVMCTWPLGGKRDDWEKHWQFGYFNECMTGFEHQVASHMIWEDKLDYGLTLIKAIHERYGAEKRNPYNEIECSDHYARAMASYGAFIAACGYTYNGPKGQLGFAPKMNPENFKAAFISAEGWGSICQTRTATSQTNTVKMAQGKLHVQELEVALPEGKSATSIEFTLNHKSVDATVKKEGNKTIVIFESVGLMENDRIAAVIKF